MKLQEVSRISSESIIVQANTYQKTVLLALIFLIFSLGYLPFHAFAAFLLPAAKEFGVERGDLAAVISLYWVVRALTAPIVGFSTKRVGPIQVQFFGTVVLAVTFLIASQVTSLLGLYLTYGVGFGLSAGAITDVPAFTLLRSFFSQRLGMALGIAATGMSTGLILMPVVVSVVQQFGWRASILGLAIAVPLLLCSILVVAKRIAGGHRVDISNRAFGDPNMTIRSTLWRRAFWLFFVAVVLGPFAFHTPLVHQIAYLTEYGYSTTKSGWIVTMVGVSGVCGRLIAGRLSDKIGRTKTYSVSALLTSASLLVLPLSTGIATGTIVFYAVAFGLGYGAFAPLFPAASADLFGGHNYPAIHSLLFVGVGVGGALGAWIPGVIFDYFQSYQPAMVISATMILLSAWCYGTAQSARNFPAQAV